MIFISVSGSTPSEFGCSADMHVGRLRDGGGTTTRHDTQVRVIMELLLRAINVPVLLSDVSTRDDRLLSQQCSKLDCSSIGLSAGRPHCSYCTCRSHLVPTFKFGHVLRQKKGLAGPGLRTSTRGVIAEDARRARPKTPVRSTHARCPVLAPFCPLLTPYSAVLHVQLRHSYG